jgi:DNA-directed RNA polymerase subunit H (RpoH/RPB5)
MKEKIYILDTNIILQNVQNIERISDHKTNHIVIPETVLLELEDKKKLSNELGFHSREFARLLAKMKIKKIDYKPGFKVVKLFNDDINLDIISKDKSRLGYIAQDVKKIFPKNVEIRPMSIYNSSNEVVEEITDCLSIDAEQIQLSLYGAFKHAVTKIEALEAENKQLHTRLAHIEDRLMQHNI